MANNLKSVQEKWAHPSSRTNTITTKTLQVVTAAELDDNISPLLTSVVDVANRLDISTLDKKPSFLSKMFGKGSSAIIQFKNQFESIDGQIKQIEDALAGWLTKLANRVNDLDSLAAENKMEFTELTGALEYGQELLDSKRQKMDDLTASMASASEDDKLRLAQAVADIKSTIVRIETRINNIRFMRHATLTNEATIRAARDNSLVIADNIETTMAQMIPEWRKQFMLAIVINEQKQAQKLSSSIVEMNNQLMTKNAEMLGVAMVDAAKASYQSVVSMNTLSAVHNSLIGAFREVDKQQQQAIKQYTTDKEQLYQMEQELLSLPLFE